MKRYLIEVVVHRKDVTKKVEALKEYFPEIEQVNINSRLFFLFRVEVEEYTEEDKLFLQGLTKGAIETYKTEDIIKAQKRGGGRMRH